MAGSDGHLASDLLTVSEGLQSLSLSTERHCNHVSGDGVSSSGGSSDSSDSDDEYEESNPLDVTASMPPADLDQLWPISVREVVPPKKKKSNGGASQPTKSHKKLPKEVQRTNKELRKERIEVCEELGMSYYVVVIGYGLGGKHRDDMMHGDLFEKKGESIVLLHATRSYERLNTCSDKNMSGGFVRVRNNCVL